jgi:hypothetical protein
VLLSRFLPAVLLMLALSGCTLFRDPPPPAGCPPVYIVKEMSKRSDAGITTRLRGVRDVECVERRGELFVKAALLTNIAVDDRPQRVIQVPLTLTVAAVDTVGAEIVTRRTISRTLEFTPEDAPARTRPLSIEIRLPDARRVGTVYVGIAGGTP